MAITTSRPDPAARQSVYADITARILDSLAAGTVPWRVPWRATGHRNAISGRPYRGINALLLALTALERQFTDARWLTFRQALALDGHVRRGERGTRVVLWKWPEPAKGDEEEQRRTPLLRSFTVFNVDQCDELALGSAPGDGAFDPIERAEAILAGYGDGPSLHLGADAAYYIPAQDQVHVPARGYFRDGDAYYATLFHELAHSTGHPSRLDRGSYRTAAPFGSEVYSREELVAEFGAAFLCAAAGIDASRVEQSAAYIESWIRALSGDQRLAVTAAGLGQRAADWILRASDLTTIGA